MSLFPFVPKVNYTLEAVDDDFFLQPISSPPVLTDEKGLTVTITSPLGTGKLLFDSLEGQESISEPFEFKLRCYSKELSVDFKKLLGKNVSVSLKTNSENIYIAGVVIQVRSLQSFILDADEKEKISYYGITLRPKFWCANFSRKTRIFFQKSTKDIIEEVLGEEGVNFDNKASSLGTTVREYCVQYNESNFDFVSRLMESEGIFYFFTYASSGETMVLAEKNKDAESLSAEVSMKIVRDNTLNTITNFNFQNQIVSKKYSSVDYDYTKPDTKLKATGKGEGLLGEVYEYPGGYVESSEASKIGERRIKSIAWPNNLAYGEGHFISFCSGSIFELKDHIRSALNQKYLLYSVNHKIAIEGSEFSYINKFVALPESVPFTPFPKTSKPYIPGTQTAVVVGPSGKEISIDEAGRILVQFHWDLEGKDDGANSCPVRCMQGWAGPGFGWAAIPRIGMEVVVSFREGDPDQPLVIGCVYNGKNKVPEEVNQKPEILILKTRTTPKGKEKSNIMSFDDTKDAEKITFNATKDYELSSIADDNSFLLKQAGSNTKTQMFITEGLVEGVIDKGEYKMTITEGNYTIALKKGSYIMTLDDGFNMLTIKKGDYSIKIEDGSLTIETKKEISIKTESTLSIEAKDDITVKTDAALSITAAKDISIKSNAGISIKAVKDIVVKSDAGISAEAMKDISLKATSNVAVEATQKVSIKATMDLTMEGMNVKSKAQLDWAREGLNIKDTAQLQGAYKANLTIEVSGNVQANVKSSVMAGIAGSALTALG
ncbi:MAG: type VI secretion system tip protein VgrG [Holosporales bacterium]|jgi:type VI secretion system secreted protein VgrG|nr:type VI secretion system tip protein VgrG [Holosporales bacterium]